MKQACCTRVDIPGIRGESGIGGAGGGAGGSGGGVGRVTVGGGVVVLPVTMIFFSLFNQQSEYKVFYKLMCWLGV
jgi:hypothetical protein